MSDTMRYASSPLELGRVAVPERTETYTPIPHLNFIQMAQDSIRDSGYGIASQRFIEGADGKEMAGMFRIEGMSDDEMAAELIIMNSYNKRITATVAMGAQVLICSNGMVMADAFMKRMHRGNDPLDHVQEFLDETLFDANAEWLALEERKAQLQAQPLSRKEMAQLAGLAFVEERILYPTQMSALRDQIRKPSFDYGGNDDEAWTFVNHMTHAIKNVPAERHMKQHARISQFVDDHILAL